MSPLIQQLLAALEAGLITKFSDIPEAQRDALHAEFDEGPFTTEQRAVLGGLVLVTTGQESALATFNAGPPVNKLSPATLKDGTNVLPLSVITWAYPGEGYAAAYPALLEMPVRKVTSADWPVSEDV